MTELQIFVNMINWQEDNFYNIHLKYLRANIEERKDLMYRALKYRMKIEPDYVDLLPISLLEKLNIPFKLYDGKDEKINNLVNKIGGKVKCVLKMK